MKLPHIIFRLVFVCWVCLVSSCAHAESQTLSLNIYSYPMIFGGFSFFINNQGTVVFQNIRSPGGSAAATKEHRSVARNRQADFQKFSTLISPADLANLKPGRKMGIPDEGTVYITLTLDQGKEVTCHMWDGDVTGKFKRLLEFMNVYIADTIEKTVTPEILNYEEKNFNKVR